MRTIGKKYTTLVIQLTKTAMDKRTRNNWFTSPNFSGVEEEVRQQLPPEIWDTWESADAEISSIINDVIMDYTVWSRDEGWKKDKTWVPKGL
jgi:hypothetical protein